MVSHSQNKLCLPVDITINMFDSMAMQVLLDGSDIWGYEHLPNVERVLTEFCKYISKIDRRTPTCMTLGELGKKVPKKC